MQQEKLLLVLLMENYVPGRTCMAKEIAIAGLCLKREFLLEILLLLVPFQFLLLKPQVRSEYAAATFKMCQGDVLQVYIPNL